MNTPIVTQEINEELESIIKKPAWTIEDAKTILQAAAGSKIPVTRFCEKHGISEQRFYDWKRKLGPGNASTGSTAQPKLLPVRIVKNSGAKAKALSAQPNRVERKSTIEVVIGHRVVRVYPGCDAALLRSVVVALEEGIRC